MLSQNSLHIQSDNNSNSLPFTYSAQHQPQPTFHSPNQPASINQYSTSRSFFPISFLRARTAALSEPLESPLS